MIVLKVGMFPWKPEERLKLEGCLCETGGYSLKLSENLENLSLVLCFSTALSTKVQWLSHTDADLNNKVKMGNGMQTVFCFV